MPSKPASLTLEVVENPVRYIKAKHTRARDNSRAPFVAWDGEATQDAGYCLLGASTGDHLRGRSLSSDEMLSFILGVSKKVPGAFHVAFAFDYDVNNILKDVPWSKLIMLYVNGKCNWNGYHIRHMPRKIFSVKKDDAYIRIDDVFSFFNCRYDDAIEKWKVGTTEQLAEISAGKDKRADFWWKDIDKIESYFGQELDTMVQLMDKARTAINNAGFYVGQWHGPGALASYALRQRGIKNHKRKTDSRILDPARLSFAGGWFDRWQFGVYYGPVWTADINSAYAYAMSLLPSLRNGEWEYISGDKARSLVSSVRLGMFHIRWRHDVGASFAGCRGLPFPLFARDKKGMCHPPIGEGWYHQPEASIVAKDPNYEFIEGWIFHDDGSYPFSWVTEMFEQRLALKQSGDPGEKGLKWALASLYGKSAQRTGWDQRDNLPPKWHQLEWAGAITSKCRQMVFYGARGVAVQTKGTGLISIDTDGVTACAPITNIINGEGEKLGEWTVDEYSGIVYIQNGFYWLRNKDGEWEKPKSRGLARGSIAASDVEKAVALLGSLPSKISDNDELFSFTKRTFVGYGAALRGKHRDSWRTWVDVPYGIDPRVSGGRIHSPRLCRACLSGSASFADSLHDLASAQFQGISMPHRLPWLEPGRTEALLAELRKQNRDQEITEEDI